MNKVAGLGDEDQLRSLIEAVERLRSSKFPQLKADLVREVLRLHEAGQTADAEIARNTEQAVERCLAAGE